MSKSFKVKDRQEAVDLVTYILAGQHGAGDLLKKIPCDNNWSLYDVLLGVGGYLADPKPITWPIKA